MNKKTYRVNNALSRLGLCSRREADKLIKEGKVFVNSQKIENFNETINIGDHIMINKKHYKFFPQKTKLFSFHKPIGCITSRIDPQNRMTIFDLLPRKYKNLITIGRLDYNTEGLLLLTNDGEFAREMELPNENIKKTYKVKVFGKLTDQKAQRIIDASQSGIKISRIQYMPFEIFLPNNINNLPNNFWLTIKISEGKNNEIRNIMQYFEFTVNKLIRTSFGKYQLSDIPRGEIFEINI